MKSKRLILLVLLLLVQVAVPLQLIRSREAVLEQGTPYRFKTRPIDPADPFQGRYVRLNFEATVVPCTEREAEEAGGRGQGYALLGVDEEGYARFTGWSRDRPESGDYLRTRSFGPAQQWNQETNSSEFQGLRIELPFNRFHMEESKAPAAERIAADRTLEEDCWALVRIHHGRAVLEDVLVGGQPIGELAALRK